MKSGPTIVITKPGEEGEGLKLQSRVLLQKTEAKTLMDDAGKPVVKYEVTFIGVMDEGMLGMLYPFVKDAKVDVTFSRPEDPEC